MSIGKGSIKSKHHNYYLYVGDELTHVSDSYNKLLPSMNHAIELGYTLTVKKI